MKIEIKRSRLVIEPESDQDRAFLEDTLDLKKDECTILFKRVDDVSVGFSKNDKYVLITPEKQNDDSRTAQ